MSFALHPRGFAGAPSRYRAAFGAAPSPATILPDVTAAGAIALSVKSILTDPTLASLPPVTGSSFASWLSPVGEISLTVLKSTFDNVLNKSVSSLTDAALSVLPDSVLATLADIVSEVVSAIPVLGPMVGLLVKAIASVFQDQSEAYKQNRQEWCQQYLRAYAVQPSGGGNDPCTTCPSDLFFPMVPTDLRHSKWASQGDVVWYSASGPNDPKSYRSLWQCMASEIGHGPEDQATSSGRVNDRFGPNGELVYAYRPALGAALMRITEGAYIDSYEVHDRFAFENWSNSEIETMRRDFQIPLLQQRRYKEWAWWQQFGGVPLPIRQQFTAMRRAMQGASKYYGQVSDAGLGIWPIYMDLLTYCFDVGALNYDYIVWLLSYQAQTSTWNCDELHSSKQTTPRELGATNSYDDSDHPYFACAPALADQIMSLVEAWRNTVQHPATAQGAAALAAQRAQAVAIVATLAPPKKPKPKLEATLSRPKLVRLGRPIPPVKKAQPGAAVLGAGVAAGLIYLFL